MATEYVKVECADCGKQLTFAADIWHPGPAPLCYDCQCERDTLPALMVSTAFMLAAEKRKDAEARLAWLKD